MTRKKEMTISFKPRKIEEYDVGRYFLTKG